MAEKHNYKLAGSGKTTESAEKDLRSKRESLVKKLGARNASADLTVVRTEFKALYTQKPRTSVQGPSSFTMESEEGWADVKTRAAKMANLRKYEVGYTIDMYLQLTEQQLTATKRTQPPAGPMERTESSLRYLVNCRL